MEEKREEDLPEEEEDFFDSFDKLTDKQRQR
jgi:hypothetical protein